MKFTLSWLKDHLDTDADAQTIADTLTRIGLEVESVEDPAARLSRFTVAECISAVQHPNADKLRLCMVKTVVAASSSEAVGREEIVQVVCGAPNARAGIKVVFAPPETFIPGTGITLKIAKIRGVESRGMMCSGRELEISEDHDGIIELKDDAKLGTPASEALGLTDAVFDVSLTPNRGDCTSIHGIARDLAAAGLGKLKSGAVAPVKSSFPCPRKVTLDFAPGTESACPMFAGRMVRGVKNRPSPEWLQKRLKAVGLRPISALVDVTNFLSLDRGRPLHVFDNARLQGDVHARLARAGETILALDGKTYHLDSEMTVIADDAAARGIGGVMGGEDTRCTSDTTDVFIESALFDPARTAATGRKLGIVSDARYRFERGVDPEFVVAGIELATKLILEFCGGEASEVFVAGKAPEWRRTVSFRPARVKGLAGADVPKPDMIRILTSLGFETSGTDPMQVKPPSWRGDIEGEADIVEEVARIWGFDKVPPAAMPRPHAVARPVLTGAQRRIITARRALAARGFCETVHYSFIPRAHAALFGGGDEARQLENPISADLDSMRPSLLPSLAASAARNQARGQATVMLFEVGAQFGSGAPGDQATVAAGLRTGPTPRDWGKRTRDADAFTAKADVMAALESVWPQAASANVTQGAPAWYHPGRSGTLALGNKALGYFGELHPKIVAAFDLKGPTTAFEIFLDTVPEAKAKASKARPALDASDFPAVERDFAFVVNADVTADAVVRAARSVDRVLIESAHVFDVYEGKGVPEGKKSLAVSVRLQPKERTLTDADIEAIAQKIVAAVTKATGGTLRT
jgi:phenylalanyl-tRNA synthetase beta chain